MRCVSPAILLTTSQPEINNMTKIALIIAVNSLYASFLLLGIY
tara:strand:- start:230 stop:358 length:129 start_codon:yes stop_codon:yes gene_type:complete